MEARLTASIAIATLGGPEDRDAALVHLHPALGADELLEEAPHPLLWTDVAVELAAARTMPSDPPSEPADLTVALDAESPDQSAL